MATAAEQAEANLRRGRTQGIMLAGLREARMDAGYSLADLEVESGIPAATISRLELMRRGALGRTARALAQALGVTVKELRRSQGE